MSAITFNAPYAPQPVAPALGDAQGAGAQSTQPIARSASSSGANLSSDHSGQGASNGTGTGGAQVAALLKRGRVAMLPTQAAPKSVIEAQTKEAPTAEFLQRQVQLRAESAALQEARAADRASDRAAAAAEAAAKAAEPAFKLPNPLPTAPILTRSEP
ncbi:hypothetical protein ROLI_035750 [Roseobacter fucihabitans]|uniref:Uncharacterized protein n=1 Tax=Roseobacter fucihabitans TaxID=1537242 RepID=A0ABZ2BWX9_9RHOB|nr:hypothetical protein [Roseobacter litoralis]MBC6964563.1 hypothetical protein [Roseobacter litoralis]